MGGGAGNDTYITDGSDTITEGSNAGIDTVQSSVTLTLGANLERLTLTDKEREAIEWAIGVTARTYDDAVGGPIKRETLRGLLERAKK
jgi:Ca2+-binding RTX toxin-like protein